jgi:hypothetical protein
LSHENNENAGVDAVEQAADKTEPSERLGGDALPGSKSGASFTLISTGYRGDPRSSPLRGSMAYNAANGGNQTAARESDAVIVPMTPGNAGAGKDGTQVGLVYETHLPVRRDRRKNGNETRQDKRNVSKQPKDGVHVVISSD